jgi:hypothetical protein
LRGRNEHERTDESQHKCCQGSDDTPHGVFSLSLSCETGF